MSWLRDTVDIIITRNPYFCHWQSTSQHPRCWKSFVMSLHSTDTDLHRHWSNQLKDLGWTSIIGFRSLFLIEPKQRPFYAISVVKYSNRQLFVSKGRLTIYFVSSWDRVFIATHLCMKYWPNATRVEMNINSIIIYPNEDVLWKVARQQYGWLMDKEESVTYLPLRFFR